MAKQADTQTAQQDVASMFSLDIRNDGVAIVTFDVPGESQNTLKIEAVDEANRLFDELEQNSTVKAVVFKSGKPGSFIAGADINMLVRCQTADEATELARGGQNFFNRIERFRAPVVAAIDGACLGGGFELAMACHGRVATDNPKTSVGLPEVMLGLLPGSGGTQRLPRMIGVPAALDLMLTGKHVRASKALRMKLVDDVVPAPILEQAAIELAQKLVKRRETAQRKRSLMDWALEGNPVGRKVMFDQARKQMLAKTKGNYPAPKRIIEVVEIGVNRGFEEGLKAEARSFGELAMTPEMRELTRLYFATTEMKKDLGVADDKVKPREIHRIGVLGAGLMGAGISYVTIGKAKIPVRLKDKEPQGLSRGLKQIHDTIAKRVERRSITKIEGQIEGNRVTPTLDYSGFKNADMVIEAVFEDLGLKHKMVQEIEAHCPEHCIFATNTSSIPIGRIAEGAKRPELVIGMHYFSPVEKMPLLEVIATDKTRPDVIATTVDIGRKQGKTPIVVKDGAGFYVNRILAPYLNEASHLLSEGVAIDRIDKTLTQFGFPVGAFALLDEVGLDVGTKVGPILHEAFGDRMKPVESGDKMLKDGRYGKKSKKGFYKYEGVKKGKKEVDETVYDLLGVKPDNSMNEAEIVDRCVLMMINEAARCYEEDVIRSLRDGDIGAIFGIGFPPFLGGPFRYADNRGIGEIVARLQELEKRCGMRFQPAPILVKLAEEKRGFYQE
ncbi:fatty acid oxidation complex subunit alpha FadJ [Alkalilimnicola ehrlichii]|uniref:enoyl-CoA hydratase n=1 Tax=Alkalilimnicola ehrlichii TaxID=351052 RepID=A0A3E0WL10_9GAMM|nr:fatty acid oxidation complex subunit alpha FadJ [Alkalilimnicola ehrlichii]RFA25857.1 fatty acid oxidation complex subunit alpha FadJ [Alkalilimnicola ehrlichii]RFA33089.1 fatty acid oxidation complex subunit alpha FadJ [Alkalilimnicola ehrlichii]